jgi:hypothetical protein
VHFSRFRIIIGNVCNVKLKCYYTVCPRIEFHSCFKLAHSCQKKANLHKNELNTPFFCSTSSLKALNRLKSLTFRFDKLSNLSKSGQTGENSQILTVSNKKNIFSAFSFCVVIVIFIEVVLSDHFSGMRPKFEARGVSQVLQNRPNT